MKTVLLTGSSSGIGKSIAIDLVENNYRVIGLSRTPSNISSPNFKEILIDLDNTTLLESTVKSIMSEEYIDILINNAGCGYYGLHEELNASKIHEMITTNIEVPLLLTNLLLRQLKSVGGSIINISSATANKTNPHGAAYGATKAALSSFGNSLFEESRKYGIKVTNIYPDMTSTGLYRNADFECSDEENAALLPSDISKTVLLILNSECRINIGNITLTPQYHKISRKKKSHDNRKQ